MIGVPAEDGDLFPEWDEWLRLEEAGGTADEAAEESSAEEEDEEEEDDDDEDDDDDDDDDDEDNSNYETPASAFASGAEISARLTPEISSNPPPIYHTATTQHEDHGNSWEVTVYPS
ncbi:hypothetical protein O1611_g6826 [Lasiodiplodia mahajangana]|uniref:Uncharacterized protein n=1 Tax=Lasiodiplodia mahajangana TaxID=1108764 RepID=A0ACC2JHF9_9PEZI|nr:hypothetical protein O1611_g6826 [Lasiodiplodia mahajangana]